jgi:hypothetical protein
MWKDEIMKIGVYLALLTILGLTLCIGGCVRGPRAGEVKWPTIDSRQDSNEPVPPWDPNRIRRPRKWRWNWPYLPPEEMIWEAKVNPHSGLEMGGSEQMGVFDPMPIPDGEKGVQ